MESKEYSSWNIVFILQKESIIVLTEKNTFSSIFL